VPRHQYEILRRDGHDIIIEIYPSTSSPGWGYRGDLPFAVARAI
jgi:hypothetical protein